MPSLSLFVNSLLVGASGYALYNIDPSAKPYAFSACAISLCHGLLGLIEAAKGEEKCTIIKQISTSMMEIVVLPLINIELYLASSSSGLALGHGLFIIPLVFDLIAKLFTEEGEDSSTETLKDLTALGNIISLLFLAINEDNYVYGALAVTAFITKYGSLLLENLNGGMGLPSLVFGQAVFAALVKEAIVPSSS